MKALVQPAAPGREVLARAATVPMWDMLVRPVPAVQLGASGGSGGAGGGAAVPTAHAKTSAGFGCHAVDDVGVWLPAGGGAAWPLCRDGHLSSSGSKGRVGSGGALLGPSAT
ncbi:UNVERIFIED_CONTAM: hypothetical protein K2H54_051414 [Gekko kuhli]